MNDRKAPALIRRAISVRPSPIHGYGVFADEPIASGTIIEECTMLELTDTFALSDYSVQWEENCLVLPLGYGALYNHSDTPTVSVTRDRVHRLLVYTALCNIAPDDELLINYGPHWFALRKKA